MTRREHREAAALDRTPQYVQALRAIGNPVSWTAPTRIQRPAQRPSKSDRRLGQRLMALFTSNR